MRRTAAFWSMPCHSMCTVCICPRRSFAGQHLALPPLLSYARQILRHPARSKENCAGSALPPPRFDPMPGNPAPCLGHQKIASSWVIYPATCYFGQLCLPHQSEFCFGGAALSCREKTTHRNGCPALALLSPTLGRWAGVNSNFSPPS